MEKMPPFRPSPIRDACNSIWEQVRRSWHFDRQIKDECPQNVFAESLHKKFIRTLSRYMRRFFALFCDWFFNNEKMQELVTEGYPEEPSKINPAICLCGLGTPDEEF